MLELLDNIDDLQTATKVTIDADKILSFQNTIAKPFVADLKANITTDLLHPMLLYQHCLYWTHGKITLINLTEFFLLAILYPWVEYCSQHF